MNPSEFTHCFLFSLVFLFALSVLRSLFWDYQLFVPIVVFSAASLLALFKAINFLEEKLVEAETKNLHLLSRHEEFAGLNSRADTIKKPRRPLLFPVRHHTTTAAAAADDRQFRPFGDPPAAKSPLSTHSTAPTRWLSKRAHSNKYIETEEQLESFLPKVDKTLSEPKHGTTPPDPIRSAAYMSVGTGSLPPRHVRMKKGEDGFPLPMSTEESVKAFKHLGVYPQIEEWRDPLRQWFSLNLLNPLLRKIETSHLQVMETASKVGLPITVHQVGSESRRGGNTATSLFSLYWMGRRPVFCFDEDEFLEEVRSSLLRAIDASLHAAEYSLANQQQPQERDSPPMTMMMQDCVNAITAHQKLCALMKGKWAKGLLPHSNVREDYMVQRLRELAKGSCVKNYEYLESTECYDNKRQKGAADLPSDSHILLYLFCAYLEHPKWMLNGSPTSYAGGQFSESPLFLGDLPHFRERFPENYIAVTSRVPPILKPGACILAVGKQNQPIFALFWDKKQQFSLQGRTALWDSILLLCHRINVGCGGVVGGIRLGF